MSEEGFRISQTSMERDFANVIHFTESIGTPFALRQFHLLGLLPPVDGHPRVLDNACGSGRQAEVLRTAYSESGKQIDITCCDINGGMIDAVNERINSGNWTNV